MRNGPGGSKGKGSEASIRHRARGFCFYLILFHEVSITDPYHRRDPEMAGDLLKVTQLVNLRAGATSGPVGLWSPCFSENLSSGTSPPTFILTHTSLFALLWLYFPSSLPPALVTSRSTYQTKSPDSTPRASEQAGIRTFYPEMR